MTVTRSAGFELALIQNSTDPGRYAKFKGLGVTGSVAAMKEVYEKLLGLLYMQSQRDGAGHLLPEANVKVLEDMLAEEGLSLEIPPVVQLV